MKKLGIAMIFALTLAAALAAQTAPVDSKGAMALQFTMDGLGTFGIGGTPVDLPNGAYTGTNWAATGYGLGAKYFVIDKLSVGAGLYFSSDSVTLSGSANVRKTGYFGLRPFATYTLAKKGPVALTAGGYLSMGFYNEDDPANTTKLAYSVFGGGATFGAECFVMNGVSLGADYRFGANFYKMAETNTVTNAVTTNSYSRIGTGSASVFLSFYL
ncbi:MAG: outer membrane beta-barrel protein [Spirochaetaceae bacterium]|nr:outer membrane beta-barrel protein [Spirochaetaceae bacterium]